jgi:twitching motility protein PilT
MLYLSSHARPSVRVDGTMHVLEQEPVLLPDTVIDSIAALRLAGGQIPSGAAAAEWSCELPEVGRVRCMTFIDHRGPGGVFRLVPPMMSAEQLGLSRQVQALAGCHEGLVLVAGPRSSGKRTLLAAFIDIINRTRCDHVITVERQVGIVHSNGGSLVSQREVGRSDDDLLTAARAAAREDPDVLVLEEITTARMAHVALAASASRLVIAGVSAQAADEAVAHLVTLCSGDGSSQATVELSERLRGVVAQVLLPKIGGGRVAAREVLLNTQEVAAAIAEGQLDRLPAAIVEARAEGMELLDDSLLVHVQNQIVDAHEASRHARDRDAFLEALERHGIDTATLVRSA